MAKRDRLINFHSSRAVNKEQIKPILTATGDTGLSQGEIAVVNSLNNEAIYTLNQDGTDLIQFLPKTGVEKIVNDAIGDITGSTTGGTSLGDRLDTIEGTVGDSTSGLVKDVNDLETTRLKSIIAGNGIIVNKTDVLNPTLSAKVDPIAGNALTVTATGLKVVIPNVKPITASNALKLTTGTTSDALSLTIKTGDKLLVQDTNGLAASLSLVKDASGLIYTLYGSAQDAAHQIGQINIPKDQFLQSATFIESATASDTGTIIGDPYLKLVFITTATTPTTTYIPMKGLVEVYTGDNTTINVVAATSKISVITAPITATTATGIAKIVDVKTGLDAKIDALVAGDTSLTITTASVNNPTKPNVKTFTLKTNVSTKEGNRLSLDSVGGLIVSNVIDGGTF